MGQSNTLWNDHGFKKKKENITKYMKQSKFLTHTQGHNAFFTPFATLVTWNYELKLVLSHN